MGANDGTTTAIYPNLLDTRTPLSSSFNWRVQDPRIRFEDNTTWGIEGSVGYKVKKARIELEIGYERFVTRESKLDRSAGGVENMYLLAKELAHDVVSGKTERLGYALADTSARDVVAFAQAVGQQSDDIDGKVCSKKVAWNGQGYPRKLAGDTDKHGTWSCVDYSHSEKHTSQTGGDAAGVWRLSSRFKSYDGHGIRREDKEDKKLLQSYTNRGWPGTAEGKINTAQGMAGDLVGKLTDEEKETVAGILTRVVSGGEVIEIRAVATTSVMFNACYDLRRGGLVPFGCVGVGTNLISVTDGHLDAKLAYKLKAGLSYKVAPRVTAFVSSFYHQVLGDGEYYDVPVQHLRDDQSPEGRSNNYALAKFEMAYVGAEIGMRFAF